MGVMPPYRRGFYRFNQDAEKFEVWTGATGLLPAFDDLADSVGEAKEKIKAAETTPFAGAQPLPSAIKMVEVHHKGRLVDVRPVMKRKSEREFQDEVERETGGRGDIRVRRQ